MWALTGPYFNYSDTWQLFINTGTTIVTFLMVFLIQNTQNRETRIVALKLDELLRGVEGARTGLVELDHMSDDDLELVRQEFARLRIPAHTYLMFSHREHISTIRSTIMTIWGKWLPESGRTVADAPNFERYGPEFDPRTGNGGMEIWIPVEP